MTEAAQGGSRFPNRRGLPRMRAFYPGLALALISFLLNLLWAMAVPPLNTPDEPSHLQAVMQVRRNLTLPEIHYDFSHNPGGEVVGHPGFPDVVEYTFKYMHTRRRQLTSPYEAMQPPLYYVTAGLAARLVPDTPADALLVSRVISALFGAGVVYFIWAAVRQLAPRAPVWAVATAGVVALLPQFCFNSMTASNDSALNFACALSFYVWFRGLREPLYDRWLLRAGAALGIGILAKLTALALLPGLALVLLFRAWGGKDRTWGERGRAALLMAAGAAGVTLLVCGWWLVRNLFVYGEFTGSRDALRYYVDKFGHLDVTNPESRTIFLTTTWESYWGRFGWLAIPLPSPLYFAISYVAWPLVALSGLVLVWIGVRRLVAWQRAAKAVRAVPGIFWRAALVMLAVWIAVAVAYVQFSIKIGFQPQSRYLFPALLPAALLFTGGLYAVTPRRFKPLSMALLIAWLAYLNAAGLSVASIRN